MLYDDNQVQFQEILTSSPNPQFLIKMENLLLQKKVAPPLTNSKLLFWLKTLLERSE